MPGKTCSCPGDGTFALLQAVQMQFCQAFVHLPLCWHLNGGGGRIVGLEVCCCVCASALVTRWRYPTDACLLHCFMTNNNLTRQLGCLLKGGVSLECCAISFAALQHCLNYVCNARSSAAVGIFTVQQEVVVSQCLVVELCISYFLQLYALWQCHCEQPVVPLRGAS